MKNGRTEATPRSTNGPFRSLNTVPEPGRRSAFIEGRLIHRQTNTITAIGTTQKNAPRQSMPPPGKAPNGGAITVASALPPSKVAWFGTITTMVPETAITSVGAGSALRSRCLASEEMNRLVNTTKAPEMAMA